MPDRWDEQADGLVYCMPMTRTCAAKELAAALRAAYQSGREDAACEADKVALAEEVTGSRPCYIARKIAAKIRRAEP